MKTSAIGSELKSALERLRLGPMIDSLPQRLALAEKDQVEPRRLLRRQFYASPTTAAELARRR